MMFSAQMLESLDRPTASELPGDWCRERWARHVARPGSPSITEESKLQPS